MVHGAVEAVFWGIATNSNVSFQKKTKQHSSLAVAVKQVQTSGTNLVCRLCSSKDPAPPKKKQTNKQTNKQTPNNSNNKTHSFFHDMTYKIDWALKTN